MTRCACAVDGCSNTSYINNPPRFFRIPHTDPIVAAAWLKLIGRAGWDTSRATQSFVCSAHFTAECFTTGKGRLRLTRNAQPCVNLPSTSVKPVAVTNKSTQCDAIIETTTKPTKNNESSASKQNLNKQHKEIFDELCDKFLHADVAQMIKEYGDMKLRFRKVATDFNLFHFKLYFTSPSSYLALQKVLSLKDKQTLAHLFMKNAMTDMKKLYNVLEPKFESMSCMENKCVLLIGQVSMKPHLYYHIRNDKVYGFSEINRVQNSTPANKAIVIMARGIYDPWVQPIDYALLSNEDTTTTISTWIHETIKNLLLVGLNIGICISNLAPETITASEHHTQHVGINKPFFVIDRKPIYFMSDPTLSIKKMYKAFKDHEFHFHDSVAKWQHVIDFYTFDTKKSLRLAPNLTYEHMAASGDDVPFSVIADTLSETVAAGMATYVEFGVMEEEASGTVQFLTIMNRLIDFTRSTKAPHQRVLRTPFTGTDAQNDCITDAQNYLRDLRVYKNGQDVTNTAHFLTELQVAIRSLLLLNEDLVFEGHPNLYTKFINFNIMTNFFQSVAKRNSNTGKLLPWRLVESFRRMVFRNALNTPKCRGSSESVSTVIYEYLKKTSGPDIVKAVRGPQTSFKLAFVDVRIYMCDYMEFKLPWTNQLQALGEFVLTKCIEKHAHCSVRGTRKPANRKEESVETRYPQYRFDKETKKVTPDKYFLLYLRELESEIESYFKTDYVNLCFMGKLDRRSEPTVDSFDPPCYCFPARFMKKLYFRLRIRQILRMNNTSLRKNPNDLTFRYFPLA